MTLNDFNNQVLRPMVLSQIKNGRLDHAIQSDDCQDIIENDPELKTAVNQRLYVLQMQRIENGE